MGMTITLCGGQEPKEPIDNGGGGSGGGGPCAFTKASFPSDTSHRKQLRILLKSIIDEIDNNGSCVPNCNINEIYEFSNISNLLVSGYENGISLIANGDTSIQTISTVSHVLHGLQRLSSIVFDTFNPLSSKKKLTETATNLETEYKYIDIFNSKRVKSEDGQNGENKHFILEYIEISKLLSYLYIVNLHELVASTDSNVSEEYAIHHYQMLIDIIIEMQKLIHTRDGVGFIESRLPTNHPHFKRVNCG